MGILVRLIRTLLDPSLMALRSWLSILRKITCGINIIAEDPVLKKCDLCFHCAVVEFHIYNITVFPRICHG